jgi:hypothetical protein
VDDGLGAGDTVTPGLPLGPATAVGVGVGVGGASSPPGRRIPAALAIKAAAVTHRASSAMAATPSPALLIDSNDLRSTPLVRPHVPRGLVSGPSRIATFELPGRTDNSSGR